MLLNSKSKKISGKNIGENMNSIIGDNNTIINNPKPSIVNIDDTPKTTINIHDSQFADHIQINNNYK